MKHEEKLSTSLENYIWHYLSSTHWNSNSWLTRVLLHLRKTLEFALFQKRRFLLWIRAKSGILLILIKHQHFLLHLAIQHTNVEIILQTHVENRIVEKDVLLVWHAYVEILVLLLLFEEFFLGSTVNYVDWPDSNLLFVFRESVYLLSLLINLQINNTVWISSQISTLNHISIEKDQLLPILHPNIYIGQQYTCEMINDQWVIPNDIEEQSSVGFCSYELVKFLREHGHSLSIGH